MAGRSPSRCVPAKAPEPEYGETGTGARRTYKFAGRPGRGCWVRPARCHANRQPRCCFPEHAVTKNDPPGYAGRPPRCLLPRKPMPVVLLVLVALLAAAPARAGDDDYGRSLGKQQLDVWDRLKGIDRSMQHDADHPDRMGEDPGDDDEDDVGDDVGAKAPARRTAPGAPAVPPAPS